MHLMITEVAVLETACIEVTYSRGTKKIQNKYKNLDNLRGTIPQ